MSRKLFVSLIVLAGMALQALAVSVTFQVNMRVQRASGNFSTGDTVVVRGSMNGWSGNANYGVATGGDSIYSITMDIPTGNIEYKFAIVRPTGDVWEGVNNRQFAVPATGPVTIPAVYFNYQTVVANYDIEVFFRVNMNVQILSGNFIAANDWVVIRGGHAALGNWGGAVARLTEETGNPGIYSAWIQISSTAIAQAIEYKFVYLTGGNPSNETSHWETIANNRSITPSGSEPDVLPPPSGNGFHEVMPNP
ncbi:MAG: hypothetical protein OEM52_10250, partial [bacterium]|nr:hypothetical protein [bacterium]